MMHQPTDGLIQRLAREAGGHSRRYRSFLPRLMLATGAALALAIIVVIVSFGIRADFISYATSPVYSFKLLATACAAIAGLALVRAAGTPGIAMRWLMMALPVAVLIAGMVWIDDAVSIVGARSISVPVCLAAIVLAALPGLILLLIALRNAAPTRPALAGSVAGLLAGSLGALAYTLSCVNDGAVFVTVWYSLAVVIVSALGAVVGRRVLSW